MSSSFPYRQPNGNNNGNGSQSNNNGTNSTLSVSAQNAAALAALVQQQQQSDTSSPISALVADQFQQNQQQDLRTLALHHQLSTLMQQTQLQQQQPAVSQSQQQPQPSFSAFLPINQQIRQQTAPCSSAQLQQQQTAPGGSSLLGIYQHLLSLQAQQQQQHNSTPTVAGLPQQFSNALHLQNSPAAAVLPPQLGGVPSAQSAASGSTTGLLSTLLASNPALLHSLLGQQQQQQQQQLVALAAQLLLPAAAQQQQQQSQTSLLQMLNPTSLYAFVNYLQQQQQQAQPPPVNQQLQLLLQLASNGGGNAGGNIGGLQGLLASLSGNQQQALLTALAAQQAQQQQEATQQPPPQLHQPAPLQPQQPDENRLLLEHLIRQSRDVQQQQKLMQLEAVAAAGRPQTYVASGQIEQQAASLSPPAGGSAASEALSAPQQTQQTAAEIIAAHHQQQQQQGNVCAVHSQITAEQQEQHRQGQGTPNERLMTSEAVQDRISRLISENEAIVEPNPVLLKRRPYQRQSTSNSMTSQTSENAGTSQRGSPGIRSPGPKLHPATTRSYSLHETSFLRFGGGSLTSGQPINRQQLSLQPQPSQHSQQLTCNFCQLKFPNEAGLEAHELRCSKKDQNSSNNQMLLQKQQSQPQLKMVNQQRQQQQQLQLQLQQLQDHQSTIAALVGGGKGVARDLVINGSGGGRSSVPSLIQQQQQPRLFSKQVSQLVTSSDSSRLKKRGLDQDSGSCGGSGTDSLEMVFDVSTSGVGGNCSTEQQQPGAESTKMARIDDIYSMEIQQEEHIQANIQQPNIQKEEQQNSPRQQKAQPVLTMRDAIIFAITYSTDLCSTIKMPYFLTLTPAELQELANGGENGNDVNGAGSSSRGRTRNITSETFMCLNKVRPTPNEHRDNCSAYSFWSPSEFSNGESQLVQLLLGASNSFSAPWQKRICPIGGHYSLAASRESVQLRTTHSSFWGQQQQQKIAQQQNITNNMFNPQRQHCDDVIIERGLIKNIPKNEDMEELYQLQHQQIIKMETDDKENGSNIIQQIPAFLPTKIDKEEDTKITTTDNSIKLLQLPPNASKVGGFGGASSKFSLNRMKNINEEVQISTTQAMVQVYIRGRGRGRYVCERCGIRCKKPSMLKKHLRSHTNVRPFTCMTCNFSFKTKGNLTKHLVSKTHKRRMLDSNNEETMQGINTKSLLERSNGNDEENEGEGRLVVVEEEDEEENNVPTSSKEQQRLERKQEQAQRMRWEEEDWDDDDEEDEEEWGVLDDRTPQKDGGVPPPPPLSYRRFGQENILVERETHTPPTLWTRTDGQGTLAAGGYTDASGDEEPEPLDMGWPPQDEAVPERICQSAPPSALLSPGGRSRTKRKKKGKINNSQANVSDLKTSPTKFELLQQDSQQDLSPPVEHQHSLINQQQQPPPALANFIPSVSEQPLQQQPSLAAQLAAGLLQAAPFHNQQTIDLRQQQQFQAQQFLFQQINEQQQKQQQQHSSAFAPPISSNGNNNNRNFVSALKFLECQMNVGTSQIIGGENENNINNNGGDSFTTRGPQSTLEAFLATDVQQFQCDMCERKFRKESELLLHKQTHLIERRQKNNSSNSSLNNSFQCSECPTVVRSKSMLNRHVESVHGRSGNSEQLNNGLNLASQAQHIGPPPSSSQQMLPPQTNPTHNNHFRNFLCTDCNLGFRSHGVLAKHLRSKNHVKTLVSLGKLSEDANSLLIRDHSKALGNIDASNCEKALHSTKELLSKMREQLGFTNDTPTTAASQQSNNGGSQRPLSGSAPRISSSMGSTTQKRPAEPLAHGLKRKSNDLPPNDDFGNKPQNPSQHTTPSPQHRRDSFSSPSPQRPKYSRDDLAQQSDSPLHSLAQVAVAAAAAQLTASARQPSPSTSTHHQHSSSSRIATANVWVPPRVEQLQSSNTGGSPMTIDARKSVTPEIHNQNGLISSDRLGSMLSNRSAEETSESTGTRSESSTPVQRNVCQQHPGFSPMPAATRCQLCELNFDSPAQLSVHFHADHILMRHGRDFRCSRRNCEKVFPSRESLRAHIYGHFFGGSDGRELEHHLQATPFASAAASCPASPSLLARRSTAPSAPPPCAQSPGVPEESHSAIGSQLALGGPNNQSFSSPPSVASSFVSSGITTPKTTGRIKVQSRRRGEDNHQHLNNDIKGKEEITTTPSLLCCQFCSEQLPDVQTLQAHWVKQHMAQLTRPHVCVECDAGFTTESALQAHFERQHNSYNGINY